MATKTFTTEFKLNTKGATNLVSALNSSKRVDININQEVKNVHDRKEISLLMNKVARKG